ncbi:MAG: hypothetical protein A3C22_00295 [Candidatus Levybacteria bacterium RIFCSPHIGHO2_02_FULL_37_10]|nr:MAG: hypothetical protein A3C22_00295 [Candidatus Levybacteria bacterium RIFCSPHIGHO2_02_FULL_37_10]
MAYLVLVRHGESIWNAKGLWTGWADIELSEKGIEEAKKAGSLIKDIKFNICYTAKLKRAKETLREIINELNLKEIPVIENETLNERDYGDFTGKNKWEIKKEVGDEKFKLIRRGWDYPIPKGESLKDVYNRVVPYFENNIFPNIKTGKNVLISASGNSLRTLIKYLEKISDTDISNLELATGEIYIYQIDEKGNIISKEKRASRPNTA